MNSKCLFFVWLALVSLADSRPQNKALNLGAGSEAAEAKIREKRKYEIPLLRQLEESGVGTKRESPPREEAASEAEETRPSEAAGGEPETPPAGGLRVKKQSPNNVCIKAGGCGKTVCGPIVSARGPAVGDMRGMVQGRKPVVSLGDLHSAAFGEMNDASLKVDRPFAPLQSRTVDTIVAPIALGTLGYGAPAAYSAAPPAVELGHSFFKPPAVPAVAVIAAPHQPPNPLVHLMPHLVPHLMPHLMPSLMSNIGSFVVPHRWDPARFPETIQADIKQPVPAAYAPPSYSVSGDNTLLCQPFRNQRLEGSYDYLYKPDLAVDKSINVTDGSKNSQNGVGGDEERKIREHLRKVSEIKEEISQLNRAAQRIVDQQERLTAMQQKQMWGASGQTSTQASEQLSSPYMGSGYYAHPGMPWGYSRSNILSYPRSQDDIEFFINLLRAGKKMGLLSDMVQPSILSTIGEALKGGQDGGKAQKDAADGAPHSDDGKSAKEEKKSAK